ncbi:MAG: hypothetical protein A2271_02945 [Candidatus Moranbacteria bacterium RIFOXYA12_FULL_35_19]|nr:MAG: hypothetical protein UR78_C0002G0027 [Candidatus Moranbacteria bacterium GW2011_GWF2_35_39]OGI30118.1 MAG: hypothetical protein A2343_04080 [Candidatus Moranbacteria bacterium RIFOXYB12_FULL_35_8]OGI33201.1 MAG: hypothetical protein A2489_04200 [Candidatus Moranbacteria bacterium RIFOXYC12_FULL_36_13]OGI36637.1 MAG: hypothetical protein A2271_02945 [Candidatus Moranbacteria bacterium RIFOXYA12_FULL_35_19]
MDETRKKIIIISSIGIAVLILIVTLVVVFSGKKNNSTETPPKILEPLPIADRNFIKNVEGTINHIDLNTVVMTTNTGRRLNLTFSKKGVSFMKQQKQEDGNILLTKIGLLDIAENQEANIQYDSETDEAMLIVVK